MEDDSNKDLKWDRRSVVSALWTTVLLVVLFGLAALLVVILDKK